MLLNEPASVTESKSLGSDWNVHRLQAAAGQTQVVRARQLLAAYHRHGGTPQLWMYDVLINAHARLQQLDEALALQNEMVVSHGLQLSLCVLRLAFFRNAARIASACDAGLDLQALSIGRSMPAHCYAERMIALAHCGSSQRAGQLPHVFECASRRCSHAT